MRDRRDTRSGAALARGLAVAIGMLLATSARAYSLESATFDVQTGANGEISSLALTGDAYPTNYVLDAANAPGQNTPDHEWMGELMFTYRLGAGAWTTALTNQSADVRSMSQSGSAVTVTYKNSANPEGVRNFTLVETYSLIDDYLYWQIAVTNTSGQSLEFGDIGLPLPFNEYWNAKNDVIYETRVVYHSFTGNDDSYITAGRPSGVGPFLLMTPDPTTGAGFEYMDNWVAAEHPGSAWAAGGGTPAWTSGLDVFYIHSNVIKSTGRGYLPDTSLVLAAGESQTYAFKFFKVASHADVQGRLYSEGLIDVTVVPSLMLATNMTAKIDLHTSKAIESLTAQYPSQTTITSLGTVAPDHKIYQATFARLGPNNVTVSYGSGETTTLQFYVLEPIDGALQRHATFMVGSTQASSGALSHVFDDWMMGPKARRGATGGGGWGDDWGWTKAQFLAEKNAQTPVATEVAALDDYLDAVWANAIDHGSYVVQDWWCPPGTSAASPNGCFYDRAYTYAHAMNTYFSMYKVASLYPGLASYHNPADTYLMRAYGILNALYEGPALGADGGLTSTGYMGEQTLPDIGRALATAGHTAESQNVTAIVSELYQAFKGDPYPYGSEYTYDNTGEEAVYTAAKVAGDRVIMGEVNAKTRACRGQEPVWYYYADPVTNNGENWWQFQYTAALAGYCMDDWLRTYSTSPEVDERLSYAAKIANVSAINSGQIDADPANLGTVAWTYQAMKGNVYVGSPYITGGEGTTLHNDWRQMAGEADLGLFGALRILSADVVVDPIFGLYGYGCNVQQTGACYGITPTDGVFKRLNLITQKLHMELDRDRYGGATVSPTNDYLGLTLQNQMPAAPHTTTLTITGLAAGTYNVLVGGASAGTVTATAGQPTTVPLSIGTAATYAVQIGSGCGGATTGTDGGDGTVSPGADASAATAGQDATVEATDASGAGEGAGESSSESRSGGCACAMTGAPAPTGGLAGAVLPLGGLAMSLLRLLRRRSASGLTALTALTACSSAAAPPTAGAPDGSVASPPAVTDAGLAPESSAPAEAGSPDASPVMQSLALNVTAVDTTFTTEDHFIAAVEMQLSGEPFASTMGRDLSGYSRTYSCQASACQASLYTDPAGDGGSVIDLPGFSSGVESYEYSKQPMNNIAFESGAGTSLLSGPVLNPDGATGAAALQLAQSWFLHMAGASNATGRFIKSLDAGTSPLGWPGLWPTLQPFASWDPSIQPTHEAGCLISSDDNPGNNNALISDAYECDYTTLHLPDRAAQVTSTIGPGSSGWAGWKEALWTLNYLQIMHDDHENPVTNVAADHLAQVGVPGNVVSGGTLYPGVYLGSSDIEGFQAGNFLQILDNQAAQWLLQLPTADGATLGGFASLGDALAYSPASPLRWFPASIQVTEAPDASGFPMPASYAIASPGSHLLDLAGLLGAYASIYSLTDQANMQAGGSQPALAYFDGDPFPVQNQRPDGEATLHDRALAMVRVAVVDIDRLHVDPATGLFADDATVAGGVVARGTTLSADVAAYALLALRTARRALDSELALYSNTTPDAEGIPSPLDTFPLVDGQTFASRLDQLVDGLAAVFYDELTTSGGTAFAGWDLATGMATDAGTSLDAHTAAIRGLLTAYLATGSVKFRDRAQSVFLRLEDAFYDPTARVYRATAGDRSSQVTFGPRRFGLLQASLRDTYELVGVLPGHEALGSLIEDRVARLNKLVLNGWDDRDEDQVVEWPDECAHLGVGPDGQPLGLGGLQMAERTLSGETGSLPDAPDGGRVIATDREHDCVPEISAAHLPSALASSVTFTLTPWSPSDGGRPLQDGAGASP